MTTPLSPDAAFVERRWQVALEAGPDCLTIERLGETLSDDERAHVVACVRCQTEQAMLQEFEASRPEAGEGAAVAWIVAETKRRRATAVESPAPSRRVGTFPRWMLMAASLAVVVGASVLVRRPAPVVDESVPTGEYRTARVEPSAPIGDVAAPPEAFEWRAVSAAVEYEVRLLEVDGAELWRATTAASSLPLTDDLRRVALPGKTLVWTVTAKGADGQVLATSGQMRFRVRVPPAAQE